MNLLFSFFLSMCVFLSSPVPNAHFGVANGSFESDSYWQSSEVLITDELPVAPTDGSRAVLFDESLVLQTIELENYVPSGSHLQLDLYVHLGSEYDPNDGEVFGFSVVANDGSCSRIQGQFLNDYEVDHWHTVSLDLDECHLGLLSLTIFGGVTHSDGYVVVDNVRDNNEIYMPLIVE